MCRNIDLRQWPPVRSPRVADRVESGQADRCPVGCNAESTRPAAPGDLKGRQEAGACSPTYSIAGGNRRERGRKEVADSACPDPKSTAQGRSDDQKLMVAVLRKIAFSRFLTTRVWNQLGELAISTPTSFKTVSLTIGRDVVATCVRRCRLGTCPQLPPGHRGSLPSSWQSEAVWEVGINPPLPGGPDKTMDRT